MKYVMTNCFFGNMCERDEMDIKDVNAVRNEAFEALAWIIVEYARESEDLLPAPAAQSPANFEIQSLQNRINRPNSRSIVWIGMTVLFGSRLLFNNSPHETRSFLPAALIAGLVTCHLYRRKEQGILVLRNLQSTSPYPLLSGKAELLRHILAERQRENDARSALSPSAP